MRRWTGPPIWSELFGAPNGYDTDETGGTAGLLQKETKLEGAIHKLDKPKVKPTTPFLQQTYSMRGSL